MLSVRFNEIKRVDFWKILILNGSSTLNENLNIAKIFGIPEADLIGSRYKALLQECNRRISLSNHFMYIFPPLINLAS